MSFFNSIARKIFPPGKKVSIHEVLKRSDSFKAAFEKWKVEDGSKVLIENLQGSYFLKLSGVAPENDIEIFTSAYSNGLTIYPGENGNIPLEMIMELMKNELLLLGYRLVNSDRRITEDNNKIQTIERYCCKPPIAKEMPMDQYFGNILIELFLTDQAPVRLKLMANIYSDRLYDTPKEFTDLINYLFGGERI